MSYVMPQAVVCPPRYTWIKGPPGRPEDGACLPIKTSTKPPGVGTPTNRPRPFRGLFGFGAVTCPPGFTSTPEGCVAATGSTCPPGFAEGPPGNCAPTTPSACKTIGAFYLPSQPDRCKKACPEGTQADASGICQSSPPMSSSINWSSPTTLFAAAGAALGLAALVITLRRSS